MCEERCPCPKIWNTGTIPSIETRPHVNFQRLSPCVTKFFQSADFDRNCLIFVIFRYFWIVDIPECVQNRSELFAAKIRGPVGVERAVHLCPNRQYRSPAGGTVGTNIDKQQLSNKLSRNLWHRVSKKCIKVLKQPCVFANALTRDNVWAIWSFLDTLQWYFHNVLFVLKRFKFPISTWFAPPNFLWWCTELDGPEYRNFCALSGNTSASVRSFWQFLCGFRVPEWTEKPREGWH